VEGVLKKYPLGLGFSLDPRTNYDQIAKDLRDAAAGKDSFFRKWLLPTEVDASKRASQSLPDLLAELVERKQDPKPYPAKPGARETGLVSLIGLVSSKPQREIEPLKPNSGPEDLLTPYGPKIHRTEKQGAFRLPAVRGDFRAM
jgi:hypothetical protein